jgi:hypothetical protein
VKKNISQRSSKEKSKNHEGKTTIVSITKAYTCMPFHEKTKKETARVVSHHFH